MRIATVCSCARILASCVVPPDGGATRAGRPRRPIQIKTANPEAEIIAHPECEESVLALADFIGSTTGLIQHVGESDSKAFIICTEMGVLHQMQRLRPDATLIAAPPDSGCQCAACPYMRLNTLEKLYLCLREMTPEISLDEEIRKKALVPVERMLALG